MEQGERLEEAHSWEIAARRGGRDQRREWQDVEMKCEEERREAWLRMSKVEHVASLLTSFCDTDSDLLV